MLTGSLSRMQLLQRRDIPLWLYRHPIRHLLKQTVSVINARTAAGAATRFVNVKSHRDHVAG